MNAFYGRYAREISGLRVSLQVVLRGASSELLVNLLYSKENVNTDFAYATLRELGHVMRDMWLWTLYSRQTVCRKLDVKEAFQAGYRLACTWFGYVGVDLFVVDLDFNLSCKTVLCSFWFLVCLRARSIHTTFRDAQVSDHWRGAAESARIAEPLHHAVLSSPITVLIWVNGGLPRRLRLRLTRGAMLVVDFVCGCVA